MYGNVPLWGIPSCFIEGLQPPEIKGGIFMASNYTSNYSLCQWAASDKVLRTEFNADNAKIDAALASKASAATVNSLQSAVGTKASQSALDALQSTVSQHTSALAGKGNCTIYATSYVGTGTYGTSSPNSVTFPAKPVIVFIKSAEGRGSTLVQGQRNGFSTADGSGSPLSVTWSGNSVKWSCYSSAAGQMNESGLTFYVVALIKAG